MASFFSPCSFPLLVALLAGQTSAEVPSRPVRGVLTFVGAWFIILALFADFFASLLPV